MSLSPYNPNATCPKCGGEDIHTQFVPCLTRKNPSDEDVIIRRCARCGYPWHEAPLDAGAS